MFKFITLLKREIRSYFHSPTAYIVLCFFLVLTGFNFHMGVALLSRGPSEVTVVEAFFNSIPFWIGLILIFPPITMRLFAEEFKLGTMETLLTAPVQDWQVVLSKFAGAFFFYVVIWLPSFLYFLVFERITSTEASQAAGAFLGSYLFLLLVGLFFISIGCLASVMTQNQIVAAVMSFCLIALFFFMGLISFFSPNISPLLRDIVAYFSTIEHMGEFSKGIIDSRRLVFYGSSTVLMLFLTLQIFQFRRWKP
ncbi:MAG TPA: ABC transporter permease subunit [Chthoniobacteraceae bacterium]|nr:ABC transporter permease subunit [Chthoniobacteraceae bacterium]